MADDFTPVPDPTLLTTQQLLRELSWLREYIEEKIATADMKIAGHFLIDAERFSKIDLQFSTIEAQRLEQKKDTQEALTAALTAQKEAGRQTDDANQKAIAKSEAATAETLKQLSSGFKTSTDALSSKIDDMKERVQRLESSKEGASEERTDHRSQTTALAAVLTLFILLAGTYIGFHNLGKSTTQPAIVCSQTYHPTPCP